MLSGASLSGQGRGLLKEAKEALSSVKKGTIDL